MIQSLQNPCKNCGKLFSQTHHYSDKNPKQFCSKRCANTFNGIKKRGILQSVPSRKEDRSHWVGEFGRGVKTAYQRLIEERRILEPKPVSQFGGKK